MATTNAVWGIDIGQCALKAIKLRAAEEGKVEVLAFDIIEHPKILSQPDANPDELIRAAIEKFASRNDWQRDGIVLGVPGQQTFARFCKLPPVEAKKIPDIVRFEASQQIPFDMDDVVWDYEVFTSEDSPETEVGIFAMRKDLVRKQIDHLADAGLTPMAIQTTPSAVFNFAHFEQAPEDTESAIVLIDVGAQNTDLVVVEAGGAWTRNIPLGGNNFTEALIKSFKLSFAKAESLKRTAATSKYARQIFQAMRPVFAELVAEIQRSLGFYNSTHRDTELKKVVALGNAFRLPGLQKYLENNLTVGGGVEKLEKFHNLMPSATINAPQFTENLLSFGGAYGLALQGLGLGRIQASLLPTELARVMVWKRKAPFWIASAACLGLAALSPWSRNMMDAGALADENDPRVTEVKKIIGEAQRLSSEYNEVSQDTSGPQEKVQRLLNLQEHRYILPRLVALVHEAMPEVDARLEGVTTPEQFAELVKSDPKLARTQRKQIFLDSVTIDYADDIGSYSPGRSGSSSGGGALPMGGIGPGIGPGIGRRLPPAPRGGDDAADGVDGPGFNVHLQGRLLYGTKSSEASSVIAEEYFPRLQQYGQAAGLGFYVLTDKPGERPKYFKPPVIRARAASTGGRAPNRLVPGGKPNAEDEGDRDPVTGESMEHDWTFDFSFRVKLGEAPAPEPGAEGEEG